MWLRINRITGIVSLGADASCTIQVAKRYHSSLYVESIVRNFTSNSIWQYHVAVTGNVTNERYFVLFCLHIHCVRSRTKLNNKSNHFNFLRWKCKMQWEPQLQLRKLRIVRSNMTLVHRALFTWFIILVFCICLCLRLESRTHWNYFIVFIPLWIFDAILLIYVIIKIITKWRFLERLKELLISYQW